MKSKADEMDQLMMRASNQIDIAIQKYADYVDIEMTQNTKQINSIMMIFSIVAIVVMPPQIIGGLMGMNVLVPGQDV